MYWNVPMVEPGSVRGGDFIDVRHHLADCAGGGSNEDGNESSLLCPSRKR
jgi:hypothetical protein